MLEATNNNAGGSLEKPKYLQGDWINKIGHTWWKPYILLENINGSSQRSNATKTRGRLFNLFSDGDDGKLLGHIMAFVSGDDENLLDPSFDSSKGTMKNPLGSTLSWCSPAETMERLPGLFSLPTVFHYRRRRWKFLKYVHLIFPCGEDEKLLGLRFKFAV